MKAAGGRDSGGKLTSPCAASEGKASFRGKSPAQPRRGHVLCGSGFLFLECSETNSSEMSGLSQAFLLELDFSTEVLGILKGKSEYTQI